MKKALLSLLLAQISLISFSQFDARAQIKEDIPGLCDKQNVYTMLPMFDGQKEAVCAMKKPDIEKMLNDSVSYLKDKPDYDDKGMVSIIINCKGNVVQCKIDNKTKAPDLDDQVVNVFKTLAFSKAGKLNSKNVDSMTLWSFEIANGKIKLK